MTEPDLVRDMSKLLFGNRLRLEVAAAIARDDTGVCHAAALAAQLGVNNNQAAAELKNLERAGILERTASPGTRRVEYRRLASPFWGLASEVLRQLSSVESVEHLKEPPLLSAATSTDDERAPGPRSDVTSPSADHIQLLARRLNWSTEMIDIDLSLLEAQLASPLSRGLVAPRSENAPGIVVPPGDPATLDRAADRWAGMADVFADQAAKLRAATTTSTVWSGQAASEFSVYVATSADWFHQAAGGCQGASTACRQLATSLRDAQHTARTAIADASDAQRRSQIADTHLAQADTRAHLARQAKVNAESRLLLADSKHPVGQLHYQAANNDHAHAEADLVEALADAQRAAEQKSAAQDDLKTAQKHGSHAIDDACEAERQASAAIQAASQKLAPSVCRPMPPVPLDAAVETSHEVIRGASTLADVQLFAHRPADLHAQQRSLVSQIRRSLRETCEAVGAVVAVHSTDLPG